VSRSSFAALVPAACLWSLLACGDGGTSPSTPPSVNIGEIVLSGDKLDHLNTQVTVTDPDGDLKRADIYLDAVFLRTQVISGEGDQVGIDEEDVPAGAHEIRVNAYDMEENMGEGAKLFLVERLIPSFIVDIFVVKDDKIEPVKEKEFCLDEVCVVTNLNGRAHITEISKRDDYRLSFIEGADTSHLVALGPERIGKNIVSYFNTKALLGMIPLDSAAIEGINRRTILYFDSATVNTQLIIDIFGGQTGKNGGFAYAGDTLEVNVVQDGTLDLSQEEIDSLLVAGERGVEWANGIYRNVPWGDPQTYTVIKQVVPQVGGQSWGEITIIPTPGKGYQTSEFGEDPLVGALTLTVRVGMEMGGGIKQAQNWVESSIGGMMTSMGWPAPPETGNFFAFFSDNTPVDRTWTKLDWQAGIFDHMYETRTRFTPSGHEPVLSAEYEAYDGDVGWRSVSWAPGEGMKEDIKN